MRNKVLVVDDEESICDLIKIVLTGKGFDVRTAKSGEEGVNMVKEFAPDLILLDMTMPDITGEDAARKMKKTDAGKNAVIIVMSGLGMTEEDLDKSLFAGILNKPFTISDLASIAGRYTGERYAPAQR